MNAKILQLRDEWFKNSCGSLKEFDAIVGLVEAMTAPAVKYADEPTSATPPAKPHVAHKTARDTHKAAHRKG